MLRLFLILFFLFQSTCYALISEIREEDGSPSVYPWQLKVSNGTLTDNGDGTVSLTTGGGGGGGGDSVTVNGSAVTDIDLDDSDPAAPSDGLNVKWQLNTTPSPDSASAYVPFKDEDNMVSDSAVHVPSQQSVKTYVDTQDTAQDECSEITGCVENAITASSSDTLTNKTFDANGTGNILSNVEVADVAGSAVVTESEGISSNDNDTTFPTSAAVKDYADTNDDSGTECSTAGCALNSATTATTAAANDNDGSIATTAFVQQEIDNEEECVSKVIEDLAAADDNLPLGSMAFAIDVTKIGLRCNGTCTTGADISLEDTGGNAMTHTVPTHATTGNITFQNVTAANSLSAGEGLRMDVDNAVSPETDTYEITYCFTRA